MNYFSDALKHYADFDGRLNRRAYWMFILFYSIFLVAAIILDNLLGLKLDAMSYGLFTVLYYLALLLPALAATVRRLHDIGKSGWIYLVSFIPFVGFVWLIILLVRDGDKKNNVYGRYRATESVDAMRTDSNKTSHFVHGSENEHFSGNETSIKREPPVSPPLATTLTNANPMRSGRIIKPTSLKDKIFKIIGIAVLLVALGKFAFKSYWKSHKHQYATELAQERDEVSFEDAEAVNLDKSDSEVGQEQSNEKSEIPFVGTRTFNFTGGAYDEWSITIAPNGYCQVGVVWREPGGDGQYHVQYDGPFQSIIWLYDKGENTGGFKFEKDQVLVLDENGNLESDCRGEGEPCIAELFAN